MGIDGGFACKVCKKYDRFTIRNGSVIDVMSTIAFISDHSNCIEDDYQKALVYTDQDFDHFAIEYDDFDYELFKKNYKEFYKCDFEWSFVGKNFRIVEILYDKKNEDNTVKEILEIIETQAKLAKQI